MEWSPYVGYHIPPLHLQGSGTITEDGGRGKAVRARAEASSKEICFFAQQGSWTYELTAIGKACLRTIHFTSDKISGGHPHPCEHKAPPLGDELSVTDSCQDGELPFFKGAVPE